MGPGGSERVAAHLANAWTERGDIVTLLITYIGHEESFYQLDPGITVIRLANLALRAKKNLRGYWQRFKALRAVIKTGGFDRIVSFLPHVNVAVLLASRGSRTRVVVSERTYPPAAPLRFFWAVLRRVSYPWAQRVVVLTNENLEWLQKTIPRAAGSVIPNPTVYPLPR